MFIIVTVMIEIYVFGGNQEQDAVETAVHPMRVLLEVGLVLGAGRRSDPIDPCWWSRARLLLALGAICCKLACTTRKRCSATLLEDAVDCAVH